MEPLIDLQLATDGDTVPSQQQLQHWVGAALPADKAHMELTIRVVDQGESQALNAQYRQKDKPTNVLSFPSDLPPEVDIPFLGDLVICKSIVEDEARVQNKALEAHWAHMVIHGTLHLLGYDHVEEDQATVMESLETEILTHLGYTNPYASDE